MMIEIKKSGRLKINLPLENKNLNSGRQTWSWERIL